MIWFIWFREYIALCPLFSATVSMISISVAFCFAFGAFAAIALSMFFATALYKGCKFLTSSSSGGIVSNYKRRA